MPRYLLLATVLMLPAMLQAEPVQIEHAGLRLNANLELAGQDSLSGQDVVLIAHGTLAHGHMELIHSLQNVLAESGVSSLAPTLSLGLDNRSGMYECATAHRHRHQDAVEELSRWSDWLQQQNAGRILLLGHSRGGNQIALLSHSRSLDPFMGQVLLAPMTWNAEQEYAAYQQRFGQPPQPLLKRAKTRQADMLQAPGFLYCEDVQVSAESFLSYYEDDPQRHTPNLLIDTSLPTLVIAASEDKVVPELPEAMQSIQNSQVDLATIEGADHFFRDLYAYDVADQILEFMMEHP